MLMSARTPLSELENPSEFAARHIGLTEAQGCRHGEEQDAGPEQVEMRLAGEDGRCMRVRINYQQRAGEQARRPG